MKKEKVRVYCKDCRNYHPIKFWFKKHCNNECYMPAKGRGDWKSPLTMFVVSHNPKLMNYGNDCAHFLSNLKKGHLKYMEMFYDSGERRWKRLIIEDSDHAKEAIREQFEQVCAMVKELCDIIKKEI